jgi:hypothetical protein
MDRPVRKASAWARDQHVAGDANPVFVNVMTSTLAVKAALVGHLGVIGDLPERRPEAFDLAVLAVDGSAHLVEQCCGVGHRSTKDFLETMLTRPWKHGLLFL